MLNLDTHIFIHTLGGQLRPAEERLLAADPEWSISAIVLWEIEMLRARGRVNRGLDHPAVQSLLTKVKVWPVSVAVCLQLASLDFSSDPADELIAATSIAYNVPLVTRDAHIRSSKVVPLA